MADKWHEADVSITIEFLKFLKEIFLYGTAVNQKQERLL